MIVRLVRLKFKPEHVDTFLEFYERSRETIRHQEGCLALSLLQETGDPTAFATWSTWRSSRDLQLYRRSEFFRGFWPVVKGLLSEPATAVSYTHEHGDAVDLSAASSLSAHDTP